MDFSLSFYALIPFLTLLQAVIFSLLLLYRGWQEERHSDIRLAFLLILFGLSGIPYMLGMMGINYLWVEWPFYPWQYFGLAVPPSIYLFLRSLVNSDFRFETRQLWHYAPYIVNFFYHLLVGIQGVEFANRWQQQIDGPCYIFALTEAVELIQHALYLVLSIQLYRQYRNWIVKEFSNTGRVEFAWFRVFLFVFGLKVIEVWAFAAYYLFIGAQYDKLWWGLFSDTVMTYFLSIFSYAQPYVRELHFQASGQMYGSGGAAVVAPPEPLGPKLEDWKKRVLDFFDAEKPFLDPELTLSGLAGSMGTNSSVLSQVINTGFGKNFNDFVNGYRVEAFKQKMAAPENAHFTLLALALECGFNSKATFNRAFRKLTGHSPKEFIRRKR
ncbi:MAG: helix-turn-helix domain-containing protein [Lewinellaceae bacterium]|nr:helix-turn-helix domain-containing protein [Lewinellaceae bacterium]